MQYLSYNAQQPAIIRIDDIQRDRFTASIQEQRNLDEKYANESFAYLVLEQGTWRLEDNTLLEVGTTKTDLLAPNAWENDSFTNNLAEDPLVFSQIQTNSDSDFVLTRQRNTSVDGFQITIEEDKTKDQETKHTTEVLNFPVIARNDPLRGVEFEEKPLEENWDIIYDGLNQSEPLHIKGMKNVLIKNSTFKNIRDSHAIIVEDSDNVHIENIKIDNLSGKNRLNGIDINDSTNITVENSAISRIFSPGHSAGIKITGSKSADIIINNNHIYNAYGNGIISGACSSCAATQTVHDAPVPGLEITNNLVHDTGKTPTPVEESPTHGMYIKAADAFIANNTVYNTFDGDGISVRSTAIVRGNKVWDTKHEAIELSQMKPSGTSNKSVVENNELFFTDNKPEGPGWVSLLAAKWQEGGKYPVRYENITIRNNKIAICSEKVENIPLVSLYQFKNLIFVDNQLIDTRKETRFFKYMESPSIRYEDRNTNLFKNSSCPKHS